MGARGPAPTPTTVLAKRGSWRANINPTEPKPDPGRPVCPAWLGRTAKAAWRRLCPQLHEMGVLTKIDRDILERYCVLYARWRKAEEVLAEHGGVIPIVEGKGKNAKVVGAKKLPHVAIARELAKELLRLEQHLGMTPAARARMVAHVPLDNSEREEAVKVLGKGRFFRSA